MADEFKPCIRFCADSSEPGSCFRFCFSLLFCPSPTHALSLFLSLSKINKHSKKNLKRCAATQSPAWDRVSQNVRSWAELKSRVRCWTNWATQMPLIFILHKVLRYILWPGMWSVLANVPVRSSRTCMLMLLDEVDLLTFRYWVSSCLIEQSSSLS